MVSLDDGKSSALLDPPMKQQSRPQLQSLRFNIPEQSTEEVTTVLKLLKS
jgi:hypothetical protein